LEAPSNKRRKEENKRRRRKRKEEEEETMWLPEFRNRIEVVHGFIYFIQFILVIIGIAELFAGQAVSAIFSNILGIPAFIWLWFYSSFTNRFLKKNFWGVALSLLRVLFLLFMLTVTDESHGLLGFDVFLNIILFLLFLYLMLFKNPLQSSLLLQLGEVAIIYQANKSPLDVCHYSVLYGPTSFVRPMLHTIKYFVYTASWSHPWNILAPYPRKPYIIPTQEERLSVRLHTLSTMDGRRLFLEIFVFYKIVNAQKLMKAQCDPVDALRYYAKECILRRIQTYTFAEFMQRRDELRNADFTELYKTLIEYAEKIGIEITDTFCVDYIKAPDSWLKKKKTKVDSKKLMNAFRNFVKDDQTEDKYKMNKYNEDAFEEEESWEKAFFKREEEEKKEDKKKEKKREKKEGKKEEKGKVPASAKEKGKASDIF